MNVNQLTPPPQPQLQRFSADCSEKDADFIALRLLNKRSRIRLCPRPLNLEPIPGKGRLFAVANTRGYFAAVVTNSDGSHALVLSPLAELRSSLASSTSTDGPPPLQYRHSISLLDTPHLVSFTNDNARLLVAFTNGSLNVYDLQAILQGATSSPLHTFPSASGKPIRDLLPSTGDAEQVAVLRHSGDGLSVEILDVQAMTSLGGWASAGSPGTTPTCLSWSQKGKQIAIGLESGDIVTFSPADTSSIKSIVPHPPAMEGQSIISLAWLSNTEFHAIYAPAGPLQPDVEQTHFILSLDSKANAAGDLKLNSPYLPFPGIRPPGSFIVSLRNWDPSRILLFIGDSTSSDIGLLGSLSDATSPLQPWCNLMLEETSTPAVPLDADLNETVLLGLELDLTDNQPFKYTGPSGEETDVPPPPIMYLYASDGTLTGWHVIQTRGVAYPGMASASETSPASSDSQMATPTPQKSAFATSPSPAPQNAFASVSPQNAFASTSPQNATPAPSSGGAFGFSAFSGAPSAFGSTSFGFGSQQPQPPPPAQSPPSAPAMSAPSISVDMTSSTDDSMASEAPSSFGGFGGLSLGSDQPKSNASANTMFGSFGASSQPATSVFGGGASSNSAFGTLGSGPVKPAQGFGAFGTSAFGSSGAFGGSGAFSSGAATGAFGGGAFSGGAFSGGAFSGGASAFGAKPTTDAAASKPAENSATNSSGFGQPGFGSAAAAKPAFGQSTFGQSSFGQSGFGKPAFGQSAFGQSGFGQSAFGQTSTPTPTPAPAPTKPTTSAFGGGGGFASFANAGPSAFGAAASNKDSKPAWASASADKPTESEQPKSAFSVPTATPSTAPVPSAVPAVSAPPAMSESLTPTPSPEKPPVAVATPPATPPVKPPAAPAENTTPTTTPAAAGGAFAGLTTSATGFSKLQPGFGAFGTTTPSSSPFFQKPSSTTTPPSTSIFGKTSFGTSTATPSTTDASKSAFGSTVFGQSSFGASSTGSYFGTPSTPSAFGKPAGEAAPTTPKTPTTASTAPVKSAFSAFSGSASPFGAAAASSAGKSFGDLLRQKEGDGESKPAAVEPKPQGFSRTAEEWKKPVSAFASLKHSTESPVKEEEDDGEGEEDEGADTSFRSNEDDDDEGDDGIDAFLKSDEEDLPSDEEEEEEEEEEVVAPESPTAKQALPPKEEPKPINSIFSIPVVPKAEEKDDPLKLASGRAKSTTPPGSPANDESPPANSLKAPVPALPRATSAPPGSAASGGLLGVGRPSTRPVRSSPLASRPVSSNDNEDDGEDDEDDRLPSPSTAKKARSASPAVPLFGDATSRPKTPPVLFGNSVVPPKPAPFSLTPAATPSAVPSKPPSPFAPPGKSPEIAKVATPSPSPALSGPGMPGTGTTSIFGNAAPVFTPPTSGSIFGQKLPAPPTTQPSLFGQKPLVPTLGSPSPFSPLTPAQTKPSSPVPAPTPSAFGFGVPAKPSAPSSSSFGFGAPPAGSSTPKPPPLFPTLTTPAPAASTGFSLSRPASTTPTRPPPGPAQDMQSECANLYLNLNQEFEELKVLASQASARATQLSKPGSGTKTSQDLSAPTKWVLSDLSQFKHIMVEVERELEKWQSGKDTCVSYLRELESDMLKATTRKEEIERFSKASKDTEFARMLKARMLSPDHLETQAQLRREIRTIRSRLQQLEEYIQASKKKLNSIKTGKATLKPPSLDTINRTYRNIDLAIDQEEVDVTGLTERLAKLEMSSKASPLISFSASSRDKRLPDRPRRVGREVTPNIAASTAAALNAERSAQKLKRALLAVRKEPLLNTKAVDATPPKRELRTPRKPLLASGSGLGVGAAFTAGLNGGFPTGSLTPVKAEPETPSLQWTPPPPGSFSTPSWSLPPFEFDSTGGSPLSGLGANRQRGAREAKHAKPIQMHQSQKPPPPPPPAGFSWGPVPVVQPKLAGFADLKGKGKDEGSPSSSLSGSWVSEGFGTPKK